MKIVLAKTNAISHEDWLELRLKGIGGSDCAAVLGLSRYSSPLDVWLLKTGKKNAEPDNDAMYFGRLLEPVIRAEFSRRTGLTVAECPFMFAFKEYPFMVANIDGVVTEKDGSKALLEIKTTNSFTTAKDFEDGIPQEYYLQIQHYLAVCDLPAAYIAVLIGGNKFQYERISRDDETIKTIIALENNFWHEYVLKDVPPPVDAKSGESLSQLYPQSNGDTVTLPSDADELVAQYIEIKKAEDEIKTAKSDCENKLKALLKNSESGTTSTGYTVSWKSYSQNRLDSTKLKAAHPDIFAQFTTQIHGRKFSVSEPND